MKSILIGISFLFFGFLFIKIYLYLQYGDYNPLDRCKTYDFKVSKIEEYKGILYINDSLELGTSYRNTKPVEMLYEFIKKGDLINLKAGCDTLFLYRNDKKHWFIYYGGVSCTSQLCEVCDPCIL